MQLRRWVTRHQCTYWSILKKKKAPPLPLVNSWMQIKETLYFFELSFSPQSNLMLCHSLRRLLSHIIQRQRDKNITECWSCIENIPRSLILFKCFTSVNKLYPQKYATSMTEIYYSKIISWALRLQHTKSSRTVQQKHNVIYAHDFQLIQLASPETLQEIKYSNKKMTFWEACSRFYAYSLIAKQLEVFILQIITFKACLLSFWNWSSFISLLEKSTPSLECLLPEKSIVKGKQSPTSMLQIWT